MKRNFVLNLLLICYSIGYYSCQAHTPTESGAQDAVSEQNQMYIEDSSINGVMDRTATFLQNQNVAVNNDKDFARIMIFYNLAAINLTNILLSKGKNDTIIKFAKKSITWRKNVIKEMELFLREEPEGKTSGAKDFQKTVNNAGSKMKGLLILHENNIDDIFIQSMIVLNQAGIALTEAVLEYGSHQTFKIYARDILFLENNQLQQFKSWLKAV